MYNLMCMEAICTVLSLLSQRLNDFKSSSLSFLKLQCLQSQMKWNNEQVTYVFRYTYVCRCMLEIVLKTSEQQSCGGYSYLRAVYIGFHFVDCRHHAKYYVCIHPFRLPDRGWRHLSSIVNYTKSIWTPTNQPRKIRTVWNSNTRGYTSN